VGGKSWAAKQGAEDETQNASPYTPSLASIWSLRPGGLRWRTLIEFMEVITFRLVYYSSTHHRM
jgi:hypothetical protein